jgi:cold-inducible RNA-binding protein
VKIYVGNLSYSTENDGLRTAFEQFGAVNSAEVVFDRNTNRSRGFGFVEMPNDDEGKAAIDGMNGKDLDGRPIKVNEARPRTTEGGGGGGGGYRY